MRGNLEEIESEVKVIANTLNRDSGYIFNNIHNLPAETEPEKIIAMYRAAERLP